MAREDERKQLADAFRLAVDGEHRFGNRSDVRPELEARWLRVVDLVEQLCRPTKRSK